MTENIQKAYYAIIPANVRYDKNLTPNAKLLYGEITALCNSEGYCWAENSYFAELYGVSKTSISKWIKSLIDGGYINSKLIYKQGSKEIDKRYLTIVTQPIEEKLITPLRNVVYPIEEKLNTPIEEKLKDNNTGLNITVNNTNNITANKEIYKSVIDYLNEKTGMKFRATNKDTQKHINARLTEGYSVEDFKTVIDKKVAEWTGTEWAKFLRPSTLFGTKFESYLNAPTVARKTYGKTGVEIDTNAEDDLSGYGL